MADRPQVYKSGKVEKLEYWRDRYEKSPKRDQAHIATQHALAVHEALVELIKGYQAMALSVERMERGLDELLKRQGGTP